MRYAFSLLLSLLILTACGGGGGGSGSHTPVLKSGVFIDAPVEGLRYETATLSGKTDRKGTFSYKEGETVTFKIGNLVLGSSIGADIITPLSLTGESDLNNIGTKATNIARILQTLDENDSDNVSIKIPSVLDNLNVGSIDLANESSLTSITSQAQLLTSKSYSLVSATDAMKTMKNFISAYKNYEPISKTNYLNSGIKYYLLSIPRDSNVYFTQFGTNSFNVGMAIGGRDTISLYDLDMNYIESTCCGVVKPVTKGTYILKVNHAHDGSTLLINYPDLVDQTKFTAIKNGTYNGVNIRFYSLHMPVDGSIQFSYEKGLAGGSYPAIIYDTNLSSLGYLHTISYLPKGDYVIMFGHGTNSNPLTVTSSSLQY